jgi:HptB-dependent secretion and biofilm anti anti-sigma factor
MGIAMGASLDRVSHEPSPSSQAVRTELNITVELPIHESEEDIVITTQIHGAVGLIKVDGRLTFQEYEAFKTCTKEILDGHWITEIDVDLSETTYLDSNALSMLIGLKNRSEAKHIGIKLVRPSHSIQAILEMVQFEKLFQIVD